jgi:hypothetical protein
MPCRPTDRSAPARRFAGWRAIGAVMAMGMLVLAAGCESEPSTSSSASTTGSAAGAGPGSATGEVSTAPPASNGGPAPTTGASGDGDTTAPSTDPTTTDRPTVLTNSSSVSLPGGTSSTWGGIRTVDFAELTYPTSVCADIIDDPPRGGFQLHEGTVHADEDGSRGPYTVALRPTRSFGDVNADGHEDTALVLECSRGGQPVPMGWIYTVDDSGPRPLAGVALDRDALPITGVLDTSLISVRISGRSVLTTWDVYLDGDALCCPTETASVTWTWTDGGLTPGAPTLAGTEPGR